MSKNRKPHKKKQQPAPIPPQAIPEPVKPNWIVRTFDTGWKQFLGFAAIIGFITSWLVIYDRWIKSDKEKADEETTWQGDLKPPPITPTPTYKSTATTTEGFPLFFSSIPPTFSDSPSKKSLRIRGVHITDFNPNKPINILLGTFDFSVSPEYLYQGVNLLETAKLSCSNVKLIMGLNNNRIFVSTELKSLENEQTAGIINFNHWKVFKENVLEYPKENDTMFEVQDKQNKIIFSIKYGRRSVTLRDSNNVKSTHQVNTVSINGYFLGDTAISVFGGSDNAQFMSECILKSAQNWKEEALELISQIHSIFDKHSTSVPTNM